MRTGVPFEKAWMARIRSANQDMAVIAVDPLATNHTDNLRRFGHEFSRALQP